MTTQKSELRSVLECGTLNEVLTIVARLNFLPGYEMGRVHQEIIRLAKEAEKLEEQAARWRDIVRASAEKLVGYVARNWTADAIRDATGYEP